MSHLCRTTHLTAGYLTITALLIAGAGRSLLTVVMLGSYLFFILFPVDSPYYRFARPGPPLAGHFFYDAVQALSSRGGARGGAFPSAHASGAIVLLLVAWRHQRRLAIALSPFILGLLVATVYCRFHYVLDTVAGVALGVVVVAVGRRVCDPRSPGPQVPRSPVKPPAPPRWRVAPRRSTVR